MKDDLYRQVTNAAASAVASARVHVVATVLSYSASTRTVSVRPVQQALRPNGDVVRLPDVHGVKLGTYDAGGFVIAGPVSRDDIVLLEVPDQSIDRWLEDGVVVGDDAARAGRQLAHAIALPVGGPASDAFDPGDNLVVGRKSGGVQLVITPDGKVSLGSAGVDLVDTLYDALLGLAAATVTIPSGGGTSPLSNATSLGSLASQVATVKR